MEYTPVSDFIALSSSGDDSTPFIEGRSGAELHKAFWDAVRYVKDEEIPLAQFEFAEVVVELRQTDTEEESKKRLQEINDGIAKRSNPRVSSGNWGCSL